MVTACWCENSPSIDRSRVRCYSKVKKVYLYKKSIYIYIFIFISVRVKLRVYSVTICIGFVVEDHEVLSVGSSFHAR